MRRVENGNLVIEARKESWQGMNYTSARLLTKGKMSWQYGKIEVRAKLPRGRGTWPAIWMLGDTNPLKWPMTAKLILWSMWGLTRNYPWLGPLQKI
jgi:beta-glucanase (GH16 family)